MASSSEGDLDELASRLVRKLEMNPAEGRLAVAGERLLLVTPVMLVHVQKELENLMGPAARAPVYAAGTAAARVVATTARDLISEGRFQEEEEVVRHLVQVWSIYGYGRIQVEDMDVKTGELRFSIRNSPLAAAYGPASQPVCHYYAGFGGGLLEVLFDIEFHCHELECIAAGAEACRFELGPAEQFLPVTGERTQKE